MERRDMLKLGSAIGASMVGAKVLAGTKHNHSRQNVALSHPHQELIDSLSNCIKTGQICLSHCTIQLEGGNTNMANCNKSVQEMLEVCSATLKLAALDSVLLTDITQVCQKACNICAEACKEHEKHWSHGMHLECKACYEACIECADACSKVA